MSSKPIAVFAYDFPHLKSQEFILEIKLNSNFNPVIFAAPWRELLGLSSNTKPPIPEPGLHDPRSLCRALNIEYYVLKHDDIEQMKSLKEVYGFDLGIIAGARILKSSVIELFERGIFNIHPGKLPETSGLDAFHHSIARDLPLGVTGHFIDNRVDAGMQAFFLEQPVSPTDTVESLKSSLRRLELVAFKRFIKLCDSDSFELNAIDRKTKNSPLSALDKQQIVERFSLWRDSQLLCQRKQNLFSACASSERAGEIKALLSKYPQLVESKTYEGWTPLIVASFHQNAVAARDLIDAGADVNAVGRNGTTVLMYAKTALIGKAEADYELLDMLLSSGASRDKEDKFGKTVYDYVKQANDERMLGWLIEWTGA